MFHNTERWRPHFSTNFTLFTAFESLKITYTSLSEHTVTFGTVESQGRVVRARSCIVRFGDVT